VALDEWEPGPAYQYSQEENWMNGKSVLKLGVRLFGMAFGLAVAMFLFSSVAFGHSYTAKTAATPHTAQVAHVAATAHHANGGGWGNNWGGGCFGGGCFGGNFGCGFNCGFGNFGCFNCFRPCFNSCFSDCDCFGGCGCFNGCFNRW
jgi:hypothetical protein